MIECTSCHLTKSSDEFSPQRTNPKKLYAWCDGCRRTAAPLNNKRYDLSSERATMRAKALQMRKFDDATAAELHRLNKTDRVPLKELAVRFDASISTISKTIRRVNA